MQGSDLAPITSFWQKMVWAALIFGLLTGAGITALLLR